MANLRISLHGLTLTGVEESDVEIGRGAYGVVKQCTYNGQTFAEKIVHSLLAIAESEQQVAVAEKFESECKRLSEFNHPNIVCFIGVFFKGTNEMPSLVMELLPMSLDSALSGNPGIPNCMKYVILRDVAYGLGYLHSRKDPVVHRDLTSKNVVLTDNFRAKIVDFGVARVVPPVKVNEFLKLTKIPGNAVFMPPEAFSDDPEYDSSLDMFSYGVLILNVVNQTWPKTKGQVEGTTILTELQRRVDDLETPAMSNHPLKDFAVTCLDQAPQQRPTALDAVKEVTQCVDSCPLPYSDSLKMLKEIDNLRTSVQRLEMDLENIRNEAKYKSSENDQLQERVVALEGRLCAEVDDLKREVAHRGRTISRLEQEYAVHDETVTGKDNRIAALERDLAALRNMPSNKKQLLDPTARLKWRKCNTLPDPRKHLQAVEVNGKLYIGSGYGNYKDEEDISSTIYCLDLSTENWIADVPKSQTLQYAMAKFDGKVILIGGNMKIRGQPNPEVQYAPEAQVNGNVEIQPEALAGNAGLITATGKIQYLSDDGSEWKFFTDEEMCPMQTPRLGAVAVSLGVDLVVAGGYGNKKARISTVEIYNKPSNLWHRGIDLPNSAAELKMALCHGNDWYLLGGAGLARNAVVVTSLKQMIKQCVRPMAPSTENLANGTEGIWTTIPNAPHAFSCAAVFGGNLVTLGGEKEGIFGSTLYNSIHVYDPHRQQWIHVADMPCALSKSTAISLSSGELFVMGGHSKEGKPDSVLYKCSIMTAEEMNEEQDEQ